MESSTVMTIFLRLRACYSPMAGVFYHRPEGKARIVL